MKHHAIALPCKHTSPISYLCGIFSAIVLSGCMSIGPDYTPPKVQLQTSWSEPHTDQTPKTSEADRFWTGFNDAVLLQLLDRAESQSLTLQSATRQIEQAQAALQMDRAAALPYVQLNASSNYAKPDTLSKLKGKNEGATTDQVLGQVSWEIDFWGKQRRIREADLASIKGAQAARDAARLSLQASLGSAYCNVRMYQRRIAVAQSNLAQQAENMRIAEARYRLGASSELDYRQAQTQYAQTQAQLPMLRSTLAQYQHALSVLLGETPDYFARLNLPGSDLPSVPSIAVAGTPHDLLRRRPDVRQAEAMAAAQSARIGQAEAALYPSFSLTGAFGVSSTAGINTLFSWDNKAVSTGAGLTLPLFDRGRLKSQVQVQDSLFKQSVLAYQNLVLRAQQEVEDAFSAIVGSSTQLQELQAADSAAARTSVLALVRFRAGQTDYTTVSSAEQSHLQTSDAVVQTQGALLQAHISAWRALGGAWEPSRPTEESTH